MTRAVLIGLLIVTIAAAPATKPLAKPSLGDALSARLAEIDFRDLNFRQAVAEIEKQSGVTLAVPWKELQASQHPVAATAPMHGRLMDVTVKEAIQFVLTAANCPEPMEIELAGKKVTVTRADDPSLVEPRVYDVQKVLNRLAAEQGPTNGAGELRERVVDQLMKSIERNVAPDTWRDAGGTLGSISLVGTRLSITNTRPVHRQLEKYFKELDKPKSK